MTVLTLVCHPRILSAHLYAQSLSLDLATGQCQARVELKECLINGRFSNGLYYYTCMRIFLLFTSFARSCVLQNFTQPGLVALFNSIVSDPVALQRTSKGLVSAMSSQVLYYFVIFLIRKECLLKLSQVTIAIRKGTCL